MAVGTPRQLVGLQDVLCLVVGEASSLAYFVFSHSGSWLRPAASSQAMLTLAKLSLAPISKVQNSKISSCHTFVVYTEIVLRKPNVTELVLRAPGPWKWSLIFVNGWIQTSEPLIELLFLFV